MARKVKFEVAAATSGDDLIFAAHHQHNIIDGGDGNDTIYGGFGGGGGGATTNELGGGDGNDLLSAGVGGAADILTGGAGADTFEWGSWSYSEANDGDPTDIITDFESQDTIALRWVDPASAFNLVITSTDATHHTVEMDPGTSWEWEIQVVGVAPTLADFTFGTVF